MCHGLLTPYRALSRIFVWKLIVDVEIRGHRADGEPAATLTVAAVQ